MGPHTNDLYDFIFFNDLMDQAVLDIDVAGIGAGKIAYQFFQTEGECGKDFP